MIFWRATVCSHCGWLLLKCSTTGIGFNPKTIVELHTFQVSHRWTVTTVRYTAGVTIVHSLSPFSYKTRAMRARPRKVWGLKTMQRPKSGGGGGVVALSLDTRCGFKQTARFRVDPRLISVIFFDSLQGGHSSHADSKYHFRRTDRPDQVNFMKLLQV